MATGGRVVHHTTECREGWAAHLLILDAEPGRSVTVTKTVAVHTSRDRAIGTPLLASRRLAAEAGDFGQLLAEHALRWAELWRRCGIDAEFDGAGPLHLDLFHLLQAYSEHSVDLDVGIPARGLHGEAYRGHVFWDELFVLRLLNLRFPELAQAVLRYRHRRLDAARHEAAVDLLQRCYTGLEVREDTLWLDPHLPSALGRLDLDLRYRGHWGLGTAVDRRTVTVSLREDRQVPVRIRLRGTEATIRPGETRRFHL
ncbi:glycosyl hydrolase family 65 [Streptomyces sp. 1114.5]|uniref:glycosyl hydrolase family 65 protein n=1 Tax=Streptomyces sp. 1114.5 TaxID=1938830 RepID=UPI000EB16FDB|nr:glycosyl hydrolase family 65 protein [Streptomyces sp. 1114.5]RKT09378.1 glycosyl hydrolase family 65 [Streptomyces sp. 1114.5]